MIIPILIHRSYITWLTLKARNPDASGDLMYPVCFRVLEREIFFLYNKFFRAF